MRDLAVYGAGGFGREVAWMISEINQASDTWNLVGFFDDGIAKGRVIDNLPVLGGMNEVNSHPDDLDLVVAIADPRVRADIVGRIVNPRIQFPTVIHPSALLGSPINRLGRGSIVTAGVILTTGITIGEFVIINLLCTVGHDALLSDYSSLMPQCSISGNVKLGRNTFLGSGTRILQGVSIGEGSIVGAGAVVTKSFPKESRLIGVPAKDIRKK